MRSFSQSAKCPGNPHFALCGNYPKSYKNAWSIWNTNTIQIWGYSGYMVTPAAYALYSEIIWQYPEDVGKYFIVPTNAITDTNQNS